MTNHHYGLWCQNPLICTFNALKNFAGLKLIWCYLLESFIERKACGKCILQLPVTNFIINWRYMISFINEDLINCNCKILSLIMFYSITELILMKLLMENCLHNFFLRYHYNFKILLRSLFKLLLVPLIMSVTFIWLRRSQTFKWLYFRLLNYKQIIMGHNLLLMIPVLNCFIWIN